MARWWWLLAGACARDAPPGGTDTDAPAPDALVDFAATCALQGDNSLRADCVVTSDPPWPVTLTFAPTGNPEAAREVAGAAAAVATLTAYRMTESTAYTWTVTPEGYPERAVSGTWNTLPVPDGVNVTLATSGSSDATDDLAFLYACGVDPFAVVVAPDGEVVWYQQLNLGLPDDTREAQALTWTPDGTFLAIIGRGTVREFDPTGALIFELRGDLGAFDRPIHHDVFRRGEWTYVLNAQAKTYEDGGTLYVTDGIYVFDSSGALVNSFDLDALITPSGGGSPGGYWSPEFTVQAVDWSHGNGIWVDDDLNLTLSFFKLDTLLQLVGDPTAADFGSLRSVIRGSPLSPFPTSDYAIVSSAGVTTDLTFEAQHCPSILPDGRLLLFDNERGSDSRVLTLRLDESAGTADIDGSYPMDEMCSFQGGAFRLSNGNLLGTCAPWQEFVEFAEGDPTPIRRLQPVCSTALSFSILPRAIPLHF